MLVCELPCRFEEFPAHVSIHAFRREKKNGFPYYLLINIPDRPSSLSIQHEGMLIAGRCTGSFEDLVAFRDQLVQLNEQLDGQAVLVDDDDVVLMRVTVQNRTRGIIVINGQVRYPYWNDALDTSSGNIECQLGGLYTEQSYLPQFIDDLSLFVTDPLGQFTSRNESPVSELSYPFDGWLRVGPPLENSRS